MKKIFSLIGALLLGSAAAIAVPAAPGVFKITQPDGTQVEVRMFGDEHFHYYETTAGELLLRDDAGCLRPAVVTSDGFPEARGEITGQATPAALRTELMKAFSRRVEADAIARQDKMKVAPNVIKQKFPTTGTVTGLILVVEYQDVKLTEGATIERYIRLCNEAGYKDAATNGSVLDYFTAQSDGKFTPAFDVFGPITLPHERAYYGATDGGLVNQFRDAAMEADKMGLDFSKYDVNNDGFVDFLFVIFAGHGEAQGGPYESVWPAMQDLTNYVFDYFDGLNLSVAACSCELKGANGTNLDGISTICHEFSHILGLADIYDTSNTGFGHGMCHYDIMDIGTYNDNFITPSGYTAMDKFTLGWITPRTLEASQTDVTLRPFDATHESIFLVNPKNPDEYYTLENRQQQGWDKGIPGHGLVISYCHYDKQLWSSNRVNSPTGGYEHVAIVAADNVWANNLSDEAGDPFPGTSGNTSFSGSTTPGATWKSSGKAEPVDWAISNIRESEDGTITFDFTTAAGVGNLTTQGFDLRVEGNSIIAPEGARVYDISGRATGCSNLPGGVYIVRMGGKSVKIAL